MITTKTKGLCLTTLGRVEVRLDGELVDLPPKTKALLVYLAMMGKSHERIKLMTLFWGDKSDQQAQTNLRQAIYHLKKASLGKYLIIQRQSVAFDSDSDYWLDVAEFEERALSPEKADITSLLEAAELYQGGFLDNFTVKNEVEEFLEWVEAAQGRLEILAISALIELTERFHKQNAYTEAIEVAHRILLIEPWHEETHRFLMKIMALNGQRSDALRQYNECCRILAEELGVNVEPSEETKTLYNQIEAGEIESKKTTDLTMPLVPLQLPPKPPGFVNREKELAALIDALQPGEIITLLGPGGIGKSALAAQALWNLTAGGAKPPHAFPDGIVFHSFYRQPRVRSALENIVATLQGKRWQSDIYSDARRVLDKHQILLVLDGTEVADKLPEILDLCGKCGVLITSRSRKDAEMIRQDIPTLGLQEAVKLLAAWAGDQRQGNQPVYEEICSRVDNLPLAVRLIGRYLEHENPDAAVYLEWLKYSPLEALNQGKRRLESVPVLLERSLTPLTQSEIEALAIAGLLGLDWFRPRLIAEAMQVSLLQSRELLKRSVSLGLLNEDAGAYMVSHALIHTYLREKHPVPANHLVRLAEYYTAFVKEKSEQGLLGYASLDRERAHLTKFLATCIERQEWNICQELALALSERDGYLDLQGYWGDRVDVINLGLKAAHALQNQDVEATLNGNLGSTYRRLGEFDLAIAHHEKALSISEGLENWHPVSRHLGNLGTAYFHLGDLEKAKEYHEQALSVLEEKGIDDLSLRNLHQSNLANVYLHQKKYDEAVEMYKEMIRSEEQQNNKRGLATDWGNLGNAYHKSGQYPKALACHKKARRLDREIGDKFGEGADWGNLGYDYHVMGYKRLAIYCLEKSRDILESIHAPEVKEVISLLEEINKGRGI